MEIAGALGVCPVREDTVALAEAAAEGRPRRALDLGTGTGYVAVYLAKRGTVVDAVDVSPRALALAAQNAARNGVDVAVFHSDLYAATVGAYDVVAFNPPQRAGETELSRLATSTVLRSALLSNVLYRATQPLFARTRAAFLAQIAEGALARLSPRGRLVLSISPSEADRLPADVSALRILQRRAVREVPGVEIVTFGRASEA
ncbi:Protein-N(5)-glutamine methyltransferase PrmC [Minicystis rosea]|nr:Protein-N(5)-glutamine methyltransferase PrmC [Minicystis rosea]